MVFGMEYIRDWYVTEQQIQLWHDDKYYCNYDRLIKWYNGYKK